MNERAVLQEWADAMDAASDSATLLAQQWSPEVSAACGACMQRLAAADQALAALPLTAESSPALVAFRAAEDDPGCSSCWCSSNRESNHPACTEKIERWFAARAELLAAARREAEAVSVDANTVRLGDALQALVEADWEVRMRRIISLQTGTAAYYRIQCAGDFEAHGEEPFVADGATLADALRELQVLMDEEYGGDDD